jgi:hypothetical protein
LAGWLTYLSLAFEFQVAGQNEVVRQVGGVKVSGRKIRHPAVATQQNMHCYVEAITSGGSDVGGAAGAEEEQEEEEQQALVWVEAGLDKD